MPKGDIGTQIRDTLALAGRAPAGRLLAVLPPESLFRVLRESSDKQQRAAAERSIWAHWCSNEHADAEAALERITQAIDGRRLELASTLLDRLVAERPLWAEAWNRRAIVHFLLDADTEAVADIHRTLALEPRHFGALAGLGQIAMRHDDGEAALQAFEHALLLNPDLGQLREVVTALRTPGSATVH